jgi:hypothetical protein
VERVTEPSLALQTAIRARLLATPAVVELVEPKFWNPEKGEAPAPFHIIDGPSRPEQFPSVIFGGAQTLLAGRTGSWRQVWVYLDLHIWTREGGTKGARAIANEIDRALVAPLDVPGFELIDGNFRVTDIRFMRDPAAPHGHGIVSVEALLGESF